MTVPASRDPDRKRDAVLAAFRRRWRLTLITMLIFALAGIAFCLSVAPVYVATAQVMLTVPATGDGAAAGATVPSSFVDDQIALLKSNKMLAKVAAKDDLDQVAEFAPQRPSLLSRLIASWSGRGEDTAPTGALEEIDPKLVPAIGRLQDMVQVRRLGDSNTLAVEAASHDRARAARIANTLVAAYLDDKRVPAAPVAPAPAASAKPGVDWRDHLRRVLDTGGADIRRAQEGLAYELKRGVGRSEPVAARPAAPSRAQDGHAREEHRDDRQDGARARAVRAADEARTRLDAVRAIAEDNGDPATLGDVLPSAAKLARAYKEARRTEAELSQQLGPRHPFLHEARHERVRLAAQLRSAARDALPELERAARTAAAHVDDLGHAPKAAPAVHASAAPAVLPPPPPPVALPTARSDADRAQAALQRLRDVTDAVLSNLRRTLDEAPATAAAPGAVGQATGATPAARMISPALPPLKASFPNPALVLEFALATGLVLGLLLSALNENMARLSQEAAERSGGVERPSDWFATKSKRR